MGRMEIPLNRSWQFSLGSSITCALETVCLPHSVTLSPAISSGGRNYQGECCYRRVLHIPAQYRGRRLLLEFEGAMGVTKLFVGGVLLKTHTCGYTPLVVDITDHVVYGAENTLFLLLDNSNNEDVPPGKEQGELDFTYEGGLYRGAKLIVTDPLHITHALLAEEVAGGGVFVSYPAVSRDNASVHVKVQVANEADEGREFSLQLSLLDHTWTAVAVADLPAGLASGERRHLEAKLAVAHPSLWSPESPYLYTLAARVVWEGKETDCVNTVVGIRTFTMTYGQGLVFNGEPRTISGGNYHQTYPYIGNGVPAGLLRRDALKLRQLGMKAIRSHYPLGTAFTDACNELGLTLIVSNPGWQWYKEGIFAQRACQNLREIVRWQRNNPCVLLWEPILNETPMPEWFQREVHDIVHQEYPYTPCYTASDHGPTDLSYSEYDPGMLHPGMENYDRAGAQAQGPRPVWIREYNDSPDNWADQNCAWRVPRGFGDYPMLRSVNRMLGLDAQCDTNNYINIRNKPHICGYTIWPAIEHNRGYHLNPCWGGHLDLFRVPKFSYYFMQSQLDIEECGPVLYIANWWTEMSPDDVTVFSNAETVRLYHDDQLVGEVRPQPLEVAHPPFVFEQVHTRFKKREQSTLRAEALVGGVVVATDIRCSPGVPATLRLEADLMNVPMVADGSDIVVVYCRILDRDGSLVPMTGDRHPILFSVEGEGVLVGDSSIGANPICAEAGVAAVLVRATCRAGKITVRAQMYWEQHNPRIAIQPTELSFETVCAVEGGEGVSGMV